MREHGVREHGAHRTGRRLGVAVATVVLVVHLVVAVAPGRVAALSPADPDPLACSVRAADGTYRDRLPPSAQHWFGTDVQGCDVFTRVLHGTRVSLLVSVLGMVVAFALALVLGGVAGYLGGTADRVSGWLAELTLAFPVLVAAALVLSLVSQGRPGPLQLAFTLALLSWPVLARITRSSVRSVREEPYVEAALEAGASPLRVATAHVVPNSLPPLIAATVMLGGVLVTAEAALSFVGIGLAAPDLSWGTLFEQGQAHVSDAPHLLLFPGLFLAAFVASLVHLGDALSRRILRTGFQV